MTNSMKSVIRENIDLIDENNFDAFYEKVTSATHTYQDVADVTVFLIDACNIDPMPHLTSIPQAYLYKCKTLNEVNLADGIESIGMGAYFGSAIHRLNLPKTCREVGVQSFSGCTNLTDIRIENPDIVIDTSAFTQTNDIGWIMYTGTIEQFVNKEWPDQMIDDSYVICLDGTIHMVKGVVKK